MPAPVSYEGKLYLFYSGREEGDIWFTCYDWKMWSVPKKLNDLVPTARMHPGTNPCPVVYKDRLYIFFHGHGHDGTWYTTYNGGQWTPPVSVTGSLHNLMEYTSPSAAVTDGHLHLFWADIDDDGVHYTIFNGTKWSPCSKVANASPLARWTSPAVISKDDKLYLFYNSILRYGIYCTILAGGRWSVVSGRKGDPWRQLLQLHKPVGMRLRGWLIYHALMEKLVDTLHQAGMESPDSESSPGIIFFRTVPFIFHIASDKQVWFAHGPVVQLDESSWANLGPAVDRVLYGELNNLTLISLDPRVIQYLNREQKPAKNPLAMTIQSPDLATVKDIDGVMDCLQLKATFLEELSGVIANLIRNGFSLHVRKIWYDDVHEPITMDLAVGQPDKKLYAWVDAGGRGEEVLAVRLVRDD
ncbi:hypothetical protein FRC17_010066 [Serendipita sp. 399]|nr:hypothetical protein FRC17_010066 [Serendipita sp. 399]